mmetsp:Transcript_369/g.924  ORF Transcript_369/g.924 Transcript_369/m.924 type:complete len:202 (-) Transcript_369:1300-1905(-)
MHGGRVEVRAAALRHPPESVGDAPPGLQPPPPARGPPHPRGPHGEVLIVARLLHHAQEVRRRHVVPVPTPLGQQGECGVHVLPSQLRAPPRQRLADGRGREVAGLSGVQRSDGVGERPVGCGEVPHERGEVLHGLRPRQRIHVPRLPALRPRGPHRRLEEAPGRTLPCFPQLLAVVLVALQEPGHEFVEVHSPVPVHVRLP